MSFEIPALTDLEKKRWESWVKTHRCSLIQEPLAEVVPTAKYLICYRPSSIGGFFSMCCDLCGLEEEITDTEEL